MLSKNKSKNTALWDKNRNKIYSKKGGWKIGKGVYSHGYDMMNDLVGKVSYMQVMMLNATGRMPERRLADWFEAVHICLSWPDPRIWCNHIGALGGTMKTSTVAATAAGLLANDSRAYGTKPLLQGVGFIRGAMEKFKEGMSVANIIEHECAKHNGKPYIMGYARPIAKGDERIPAMERVSKNLEFSIGKHLELAYEIERILMQRFDEGMNINGYMSAFLSDQGYMPEEVYRICSVLVNSGITACYIEVHDKPADTFLSLRCDDISYHGKGCRALPGFKSTT